MSVLSSVVDDGDDGDDDDDAHGYGYCALTGIGTGAACVRYEYREPFEIKLRIYKKKTRIGKYLTSPLSPSSSYDTRAHGDILLILY